MDAALEVAHAQLIRMRGMNAAYHRRFFSDIRFVIILTLGLFLAGAAVDPRLYLAVPIVAILGASQTAFDASYLIFSRHYAARLETHINQQLGAEVLVAHRLEDEYLFPLDSPKLVTLDFRRFSWFGFMTALYTFVGVGAYIGGLLASLDVIGNEIGIRVGGVYLIALAVLTVVPVAVGLWWFVGGEGERRLRAVLDTAFPASPVA